MFFANIASVKASLEAVQDCTMFNLDTVVFRLTKCYISGILIRFGKKLVVFKYNLGYFYVY